MIFVTGTKCKARFIYVRCENFPFFYYLPNWLKYGNVSPALMILKFCLMSNNQLLAQLGKPSHVKCISIPLAS